MSATSRALCSLSLLLVLAACGDDRKADPDAMGGDEPSAAVEPGRAASSPTERQVFFGDLHVHSSASIDAWAAGVRVGPEDAYRYARGEAIDHVSGLPIHLVGPPLDFMALTDHAEYLGVTDATTNLGHVLRRQPLIQSWIGADPGRSGLAWQRIQGTFFERRGLPSLVADAVLVPAWQEVVALADRENRPGVFTAFVGFEYSSNPEGQNLHRNVIFRGDRVPDRPFSAMDSANPEDLWHWMDDARAKGDDLIAIPHNSNGSNGRMFALTKEDGSPIDAAWAETRKRNEPVVEVMQIKGQSETHPILSPNDEWAGYALLPWRTTMPDLPSQPEGSYVRDALKKGLVLKDRLGVNPYAVGMIGSTDGHNASSPFEERNYTGMLGVLDATPESRLAESPSPIPPHELVPHPANLWSAAGLAGIWAETNTRADLFDALRRREAFSTSGPRIGVRFFAGWDFEDVDEPSDIARIGYARGVPMGGDLPPGPPGRSPSFLLAALKDPLDADLERIQIVKGWLEDGVAHERVIDVGCADGTAPDPQTDRCRKRAKEPDLSTCRPDPDFGTRELNLGWRDPDFDPSQRAFYYVRVLQVPTCRWSTYDANRLGVPVLKNVPATIQERAITSPIWYEPEG